MNSQEFHTDILSFMDLLDLDEEVIDSRLKTLILRQSHTRNHLSNMIYLLNYKKIINVQDVSECDNNEELNFVAKLIGNLHTENVDLICKIINIVLSLNPSTIVAKSEHLLQQIFALMNFEESKTGYDIEDKSLKMLHYFKVCDSVLDAVIQIGEKLSLLFLETPMNKVLDSSNVALKMHFLINTVPKFFKGITGYNILDHIWDYIQMLKHEDKVSGLKVLSSLSNFYLPVEEKEKTKIESNIVLQYQFWDLVLFGLMSNDPYVRKVSIYLGKRAVDCVMNLKRNIHVKSGCDTIFFWDCQNENKYIGIWDNFFILMESLEEKQSNIVLPCLKFFKRLTEIGDCWLNCAYNIGLRHDNTRVKLKCIEYRCCTEINIESEALLLLEALNDTSLYDKHKDYQSLKANLLKLFNGTSFTIIFKVIPVIKWSPIPFFHLSDVLSHINLGNLVHLEYSKVVQIIKEILLIPCNIVAVRKAVLINILKMIIKYINWKELLDIFPLLQLEVSIISSNNNPVQKLIKENLIVKEDEAMIFLNKMADSYTNIDIGLIYLDNNKDKINIFVDIINEKIKKIIEIVNRQYSDKLQCLPDIVFITYLLKKVSNIGQPSKDIINEIIFRNNKVIMQYLLALLCSDIFINLENMRLLFQHVDILFVNNKNNGDVKEMLIQMYKACVLLLKDSSTDLERKLLCLFLFTNLTNNKILITHYKHEMLNMTHCLDIVNQFEFKDLENKENSGKLRNAFYEKSCEILNIFIHNQKEIEKNQLKDIVDYIGKVVECGGYGCLKWILKIINEVVLLIDDFKHFDASHFINRMWKEIDELKSNNQYLVCIQEFVKLITQDSLLKDPNYNNVILMYCMKIIDYTSMKNTPLFYLVNQLNSKNIESYSHIIYILCEILLFSPVPRKDQRIVESLVMKVIEDPKYGLTQQNVDTHFNYQIQYLSISILCKISQPEILVTIEKLIMEKVGETFRNKQRYCGNSMIHRVLLSALQHILFIALLREMNIEKGTFNWCAQLLGKLPHQPSIKICLEWYISLYIYMNELKLKEVLGNLQSEKVPLTSLFVIMYWVTKHRILNDVHNDEEFYFVMDTLLAHSMGPVFNTRLNAQYLASKLYKINEDKANKYVYTMEIIDKTFIEGATDKNFVKLKDEYFVNDFDFVSHLVPSFLYYFLPKYFNINEANGNDVRNISACINNRFHSSSDFKKEWPKCHMSDEEVFSLKIRNEENNNTAECADAVGTIQKKYIPWRNMHDVDAYEMEKKNECPSDLIVVASLIDKLPNLGGMARTSEVFGVKTYVVDSLRHLHDKQFQGLSVSSEKWIDIEEVCPGQRLKEYLLRKKAEGYSIVAAEQTSTSCPLQTFRFYKKTLLLLGHEKEGVPCDLLPIMDHCVEIPQQGFVRSLNVHVTAAIFIWEYARQNIL